MDGQTADEVLDVAIVGAGVSGVYCGWRLRTASGAQPPPSVAVFEQSKRVGGRLLSVEPPGLPGVFCELGGMRYLASQPLVSSLIEKKLKLTPRPFPVGEPENLNYLRGQHFRNSDLVTDPPSLPYDLSWSERGRTIDTLLSETVNQLIPGVTKMSGEPLRQFLETYKIDNRAVPDWGFWNLLARGMSHEAYELARVTSGYDTPTLNWNAADTISLNFDLGVGTTYNAIVEGYQAVPLTLAEEFEQAGGSIKLQHRLRSFVQEQDGTVSLTVADADGNPSPPVRAKSLILAMPRRSLELLDPTGPVLGPEHREVRKLIESVTPIPLFKLCVAYDFPWWETVGVTKGRTVTDLPIRQTYYWAKAHGTGPDPSNTKAVLLASYDDGANVGFWSGLADPDEQATFEPPPDRFGDKHLGGDKWQTYQATAAMIAEVDRELKEIHDVPYAPPPYAAAYKDWGADPYGGGVNFWNVHARSREVITRMIQPVPPVPVYVCGEAYSNGQGWVEGALETAELVLQNHFGLNAPEWVSA